ncbi:MAG: arsenite methyltransferase [Chloroflexota bacterium]|nr:arsenite methyltransferase [Chloroflexota bacterium]
MSRYVDITAGKESADSVHDAVREKYAAAARGVAGGSCCNGTDSCCEEADPVTSNLYAAGEVEGLPEAAVSASLGCGNPTALTPLHEGEVVLDLGSGGGLDVLLSARRVGPAGKAYGLDMTDEMLELARSNAREAGVRNVEFLKGQIERIPLPDSSVDVVISNCVINLAPDKDEVLREAYRVLRPGGRFAVSDVIVQGELPVSLRRDMEAWAGCVAGALHEDEYRAKLEAAGFRDIQVEVTRVYSAEEALGRDCCGGSMDAEGGRLASAFIRATRRE